MQKAKVSFEEYIQLTKNLQIKRGFEIRIKKKRETNDRQ